MTRRPQLTTLRTRVRYLRTIKGVGSEELRAKARCSPNTLARIERTGLPPSRADVTRRIAHALGVTPEELFTTDPAQADPFLPIADAAVA